MEEKKYENFFIFLQLSLLQFAIELFSGDKFEMAARRWLCQNWLCCSADGFSVDWLWFLKQVCSCGDCVQNRKSRHSTIATRKPKSNKFSLSCIRLNTSAESTQLKISTYGRTSLLSQCFHTRHNLCCHMQLIYTKFVISIFVWPQFAVQMKINGFACLDWSVAWQFNILHTSKTSRRCITFRVYVFKMQKSILCCATGRQRLIEL